MQQTSSTWRALWAAGARVEARAVIGGVERALMSDPVITRALGQDGLGVGNAVSATCQLSVLDGADIPRAAEVRVEARLADGAAASEWLPMGTFYIARRQRDPVSGRLALECYDALLKANALWTDDGGEWPRPMADAAGALAALLGLALDGRCAFEEGAAYVLERPDGATSIRDALRAIGAANGGSWIVTPAGKLRLVPVDAPGETVTVLAVTGSIDVSAPGAVSGVRFQAEGGPVVLGDERGVVVDAEVSAQVAADLYARLRGLPWQPYRLTGAVYDPAAELGDALLAGANGEVDSVLYSETVTLSPLFSATAAATEDGELSDEYPYIGPTAQALTALRLDVRQLEAAAIVDVDVEFAQNRSATVAPTEGWSSDAPAWREGYFIWQRTATTAAAGVGYSDPVCISGRDGADGAAGPRGAAGVGVSGIEEQYYLSDSASGQTGGAWSAAQPAWAPGKFIWTRSKVSWTDGTTTCTAPVLAQAINGANSAASAAGAAVTALDNSLDQQGVFDRLTGNGAAQGIYLSGRQLYVSASFIQSGTLRLGGVNNGNGVLNVVDASGTVVGVWNNQGLNVNGGAFSVGVDGSLSASDATINGSVTTTGQFGSSTGAVRLQGGSIRSTMDGAERLWIAGSNILALRGYGLRLESNYPGEEGETGYIDVGADGTVTVGGNRIVLYPNSDEDDPDNGIYARGFKGASGSFTSADGKRVLVRQGLVVQIG